MLALLELILAGGRYAGLGTVGLAAWVALEHVSAGALVLRRRGRRR